MTRNENQSFRDRWVAHIRQLQNNICAGLENVDGKSKFFTETWEREGGGGGITKVISNGDVFEKGGVNTSVVYGEVTDMMRTQLPGNAHTWFAAGLSMVIHPKNPYVPTTHANWRFFELYDANDNIIDCWIGGGADLTPYYLFEEDAIHFHEVHREAIEPFGADLYPKLKKQCDIYFTNTHRNNEMRGIGGVIWDHFRPDDRFDLEKLFAFQVANGEAFGKAYFPIAEKRKNTAYGEREVNWQEIRRGRYAEFNLIHDRGTIFGLKTNGRTESILMSLPPRAQWIYGHQPEEGTPEWDLWQACLHPRDWLAEVTA